MKKIDHLIIVRQFRSIKTTNFFPFEPTESAAIRGLKRAKMIDDDYQPEGEIKKDYMAFSELLDRNPRMEIINCLRYVLMKSPPNYELPVDDDAIVIESKRMPIDDFNELDAEEIEKMETDLHVRNPRVRFNHADMVALSKAIAHFSFNFISLKYVEYSWMEEMTIT